MANKVLVTGGAGFIGSNLVEALIAQGDKVVVLDDFSTGSRRNVQDHKQADCRIVEGDVRDGRVVKRAMKGCDYVFHLASPPNIEASLQDPETVISIAGQGTLNVLAAARENRIRRVVYASSAAVYGDGPVLPKEESMLPTPSTPHGAAALMGEELARVFYAAYRLETVSLRLFNVYGPRQAVEGPSAGVVSRFSLAILREENPKVLGDGKQSRDFVFVKDVVEAFRLACAAPKAEGDVFNIGTGSRMSVAGLLHALSILLEREIPSETIAMRRGDARHSLADVVKAQEVLGYRPRVEIAEGLAKTLVWYKRNVGKALRVRPRV